jgi:Ca2+/Na+ antiporter
MLFVTGFGVWYILKTFFPETLIDAYFVLPLFFYVTGLAFIFIMMKMPKDNPKEMVNNYMLLRVVKVFIGVIILTFYWFLDREQIRSFAIIFIIFYLIYLGIETYIYSKIEMFLKKEQKKKNSVKKKYLEEQ